MPDIGPWHPILVHFVVAFGFAGISLRLASLAGRPAWIRPAATALLLTTALVSVAATQSGREAHGPAERIPGVEDAVHEHEELGEKTRNLFLAVAGLELLALALRQKPRVQRGLHLASGLAGIATAVVLYEAADHGGRLVYSFAGGVGTRTGDAADTRRLLIAGLYHEARAARDAGRLEEASRLTDELARQLPGDPDVALLVIGSTLHDRHQPDSALAALKSLPPSTSPWGDISRGLLASDAWIALGHSDSARAVLADLAQRFPQSRSVREATAKLSGP